MKSIKRYRDCRAAKGTVEVNEAGMVA